MKFDQESDSKLLQISSNFKHLREGLKLTENIFNARFPPKEKYHILVYRSDMTNKSITDSRKMTVRSNPDKNAIPLYKSEARLAKPSGCQDPKKGLIINWNQFILNANEDGSFPNLKLVLHRESKAEAVYKTHTIANSEDKKDKNSK